MALPNGTLVRGQIVHADASGLATLRTPKGDLHLQTEFVLTRGSEVVIRLDTVASGLKAKIISVDGLSARELQSQAANLQRATAPVDDLVDLPVAGNLTTAARNATLPTTRLANTQTSIPAEMADAVIMDIPDTAMPTSMPVRAVLLSRAPELPQLLSLLPATIAIPKERLEAGAMLNVVVVGGELLTAAEAVSTSPRQAPVMMPSAMLISEEGTPAASPSGAASPGTAPSGTAAPTIPPSAPAQVAATPAQNNASPLSSAATLPAMVRLPSGEMAPNPILGALEAAVSQQPANVVAQGSVTVTSNPQSPTTSPATSGVAAEPKLQNPVMTTSGNAANQGTQTAAPGSQNPAAAPAPNPSPQLPHGVIANNQGTAETPSPLAVPPNTQTAASAGGVTTSQGVPAPVITPAGSPMASAAPVSMATLISQNPTLPQGIIPAQVIGTEQSGETVLKTPLGVIKLDLVSHTGQRLQLPHDTQIQLQLLSLEALPNESALPLKERMTTPATLAELSKNWQGLEDALEVLQQTQPHLVQQLMQQHIPQPGPKLARDILFFLLALKVDDSEMWIGKKTLDALNQSNRGDVARKFSGEFATIKQLFTNPPSPDWQAAFVPIHYQGEWQQIRMYVKRDREGNPQQQNAKDQASTRFIMEVDLSRMGSLQFDGFVKKQPLNTQFDLVIRSAQALREEDRHAIRSIYAEAAALTGFKGGLTFQIGHPFPIQPLEEMLKSYRSYIA